MTGSTALWRTRNEGTRCLDSWKYFFFHSCLGARAEEAWTLQKCIDYALQNNPDLQAAQAKVQGSTYDVDFQRKSFFPHLDLTASSGYFDGEPLSPFAILRGVTEEGIRSVRVSGGYVSAIPALTVPVLEEGVLFGLHAPTINVAAMQVVIDQKTYEANKNETIFNVGSSFLNLLRNEEDIKSAQEHLNTLTLDHRTASSKYKEELISKNELLVAEVRLASGKKEFTTYTNLSKALTADLAARMGLDPSTPMIISEESWAVPPLPPLDQLITTAITHRAETKAQEARVSQTEEEHRVAKNERYPNISVNSSFGVGYHRGSRSNTLWTATLDLTMPLFDFGAQGSKIDSLNAKVIEAERILRSIKINVSHEVITAWTNMSNAMSAIVLRENMVEQSLENARVVRGRFQQNLVPLSAVLETDYTNYDAHKALAQAKYDLRTGYLELEKAVGTYLMPVSQK